MFRSNYLYIYFEDYLLEKLKGIIKVSNDPKAFFDSILLDRISIKNLEKLDRSEKRLIYLEKAYNRNNSVLTTRKEIVQEIGFNLDFVIPVKTKVVNFPAILKQVESLLEVKADSETFEDDQGKVEVLQNQLIFSGDDRKFNHLYRDLMIFRSLFESIVSYPRRG